MQSNGDGKLSEESTFPCAASSVSYILLIDHEYSRKSKEAASQLSRIVPMTQRI